MTENEKDPLDPYWIVKICFIACILFSLFFCLLMLLAFALGFDPLDSPEGFFRELKEFLKGLFDLFFW